MIDQDLREWNATLVRDLDPSSALQFRLEPSILIHIPCGATGAANVSHCDFLTRFFMDNNDWFQDLKKLTP